MDKNQKLREAAFDADYFFQTQEFPASPKDQAEWTASISVSNLTIKGANAKATVSLGKRTNLLASQPVFVLLKRVRKKERDANIPGTNVNPILIASGDNGDQNEQSLVDGNDRRVGNWWLHISVGPFWS